MIFGEVVSVLSQWILTQIWGTNTYSCLWVNKMNPPNYLPWFQVGNSQLCTPLTEGSLYSLWICENIVLAAHIWEKRGEEKRRAEGRGKWGVIVQGVHGFHPGWWNSSGHGWWWWSTTMWMYLTPLNCTLKIVKTVNLTLFLCIFYLDFLKRVKKNM